MRIFVKSLLFAFLFHFLNGEETTCYNSNGDPVACEPSLINLAQELHVEASSTCGENGSENVCTEWLDKTGKIQKTCETCDYNDPKLSKGSTLVVDRHIRGHETCWMSEGIPISSYPTNVNLTLGLKKRSLIAFITIELCGHNPDGIVIYKMDRGVEGWVPWQYFAKDCQASFGMEHLTPDTTSLSFGNMLNPVCFDLEKSIDYGGEDKLYRLIPFNPKQGRIFNDVLTETEQEWLTATDIRISYILMPKQNFMDSLIRTKRSNEGQVFHFGSSDVKVGGQPVCHGHAYNVQENIDGTYQCECQHSTTGKDCEKCSPEFNDQPWSPATPRQPSVCKRCECNNHSKMCNFDINVYLKTGKRHGSNCMNCEDNTTGPQCDQCANGFHRNHAYPIYHRNACQPCSCHSVGSYPGKPCDPVTGKCFCKLGVSGETCSQCRDGFKQTDSISKPCTSVRTRFLDGKNDSGCDFCQKRSRRINFKRFCSKQIIFKLSLKSKESRGPWIRFIATVEEVWNRKNQDYRVNLLGLNDKDSTSVWISKDLVDCQCIDFDFGRSYLVMANIKTREFMGKNEMVLSQADVIEEWNEDWDEQFARFNRLDNVNECDKFSRQKRHAKARKLASSNYHSSVLYNQYAEYS